MTRVPITSLRNGDAIHIGRPPVTVRVTGVDPKPNGTGFLLHVIDDAGNRTTHGFMPDNPNCHLFDVLDRPDPQRWNGERIE